MQGLVFAVALSQVGEFAFVLLSFAQAADTSWMIK